MFAAVLPIAPNDSRREGEVSRTIAELITHDLRVDAQTPVGRVIKMFEKNPDFDAVAVIGGKHPQMVSGSRRPGW